MLNLHLIVRVGIAIIVVLKVKTIYHFHNCIITSTHRKRQRNRYVSTWTRAKDWRASMILFYSHTINIRKKWLDYQPSNPQPTIVIIRYKSTSLHRHLVERSRNLTHNQGIPTIIIKTKRLLKIWNSQRCSIARIGFIDCERKSVRSAEDAIERTRHYQGTWVNRCLPVYMYWDHGR